MKNTKLFKDSILEARELREVAERTVKQQLLDELSPVIKETLSKQLSSLLTEQDDIGFEDESNEKAPDPEETELPVQPQTDSIEVADTTTETDLIPEPSNKPVEVELPEEQGEEINFTMPGPDGMITVSIADLFGKPEQVMKGIDKMPAATSTTASAEEGTEKESAPESTDMGDLEDDLFPINEDVKSKFYRLMDYFVNEEKKLTTVTEYQADKIELGLLSLLEEGKDLCKNKQILQSDLTLCMKRAQKIQNSLLEKLNSQKQENSYSQINKKDGEDMSIKKSLKSIFEQAEQAFDDIDTDGAMKELAAKQKKLESQDKGTESIGEKSKKGDWEKEGAKAAASESESEKAALEEAIEIFKAALTLTESDDFGGDTGGDSGDSMEENEEITIDRGVDDLDPAGLPGEGAEDGEVDIEALLKDFEDELEAAGIKLDDLDVSISGKDQEGEDFDVHFALDDDELVTTDVEVGDEASDDEEEEEEVIMESAARVVSKAKDKVTKLLQEKQETEVYTYKTVCLNKLLMTEAIKTKQEKMGAIKALDRGTSVAEVKKIYEGIIAHKKQENRNARNDKAAAAVENSTLISEGVTNPAQKDVNPFIARMQELARIRKV